MSQKGGKFPVFLSFKSPSDIQRAMISNIVPSSWLKLKLIKFFWWTLTREIVVRWPRHSWVRLNLSFLPTFLKQHWTASSSASVTTKPTCCTVRGTLRKGWGNWKEKKRRKRKDALATVFFWLLSLFVLHHTILSMTTTRVWEDREKRRGWGREGRSGKWQHAGSVNGP